MFRILRAARNEAGGPSPDRLSNTQRTDITDGAISRPVPTQSRLSASLRAAPGILGERIFVGVAQRLMGGDAVVVAAGDLVALSYARNCCTVSVC